MNKRAVPVLLALLALGILFMVIRASVRTAYFRPEDTPKQTQDTVSPFPTLRADAPTTAVPQY